MKPIILTFARHYLPGYLAGGPIRTIANMVDWLSSEFDFRIVATDRDFGSTEPYAGVPIERWSRIGKAHVYYISPGVRVLHHIAKLMRDTSHDLLYLNSFFDPLFTLWPLLARRAGIAPLKPVVIAPRGELSAGALALKRWKKIPYAAMLRRLDLCKDTLWQASSDLEAADIDRKMRFSDHTALRERVFVATDILGDSASRKATVREASVFVTTNFLGKAENGVDQAERTPRKAGEPLRVCFLSRISPMKNLHFVLSTLAQVRTPVRLSIYGPKEQPAYWADCQRLIAGLPAHIETVYCGSVEHHHVVPTLAQHDLFFLPSLGENFGHVIHEALRAGTPVLLSDLTPWRDLEHEGVGWTIPLSEPWRFVRIVEEAFKWDAEKQCAICRKARTYAKTLNANQPAIEANQLLFMIALGLKTERTNAA